MFHAERAEVQRNRYYSPRSTAWASEDERSHASLRCIKRPPQKVFETRRRGAILHASLAENVLSGDKNRRYVSRNLTAGRTLLSRSTFAQVGTDGRKLVEGNSSHIVDYCPRRPRFRRDGLKGESPMASPKRSDRRGSGSCGRRAPNWEAPASSLLRPRASSLFPVAA